MVDREIKILQISDEDLISTNVKHVVRIFGEVSNVPKHAKQLRGSIFLGFPAFERDARPNYAIPQIRAFIQSLDSALPHFPYFLLDNPVAGMLQTYLYCLADLDTSNTQRCDSKSFEDIFKSKQDVLLGFCRRIADNPDPTLEALALAMPPEILREVPELMSQAAQAIAPLLEGIARSLSGAHLEERPSGMTPEEVQTARDSFLNYASRLSGIQRGTHDSDLEFVRAVLGWAKGQASK